jgi:hypothetical protein
MKTNRACDIGIDMLGSTCVFRKHLLQDTNVPVPVNHTYDLFVRFPDGFIPFVGALLKSTTALHEWIGIFWYSLRYAQAQRSAASGRNQTNARRDAEARRPENCNGFSNSASLRETQLFGFQ